MAFNKTSALEFEDDESPHSELQFQDFSIGEKSEALSSPGNYSNYNDNLGSLQENDGLLDAETKEGSSSFWKFSYYQSFFDVDTDQVVQRVLWSMVPLPGRATFLDRQIRPKPDLYGPFWIAATLVFSTAICANIANYLSSGGHDRNWSYDFHKVSLAATAIYSYTFLLPIILWGLMWYRQSSNRYTLLEILSVYGYSLAIYVPISVLWVIQVAWIQWILVIVGASLSGFVLVQTFWPIFREDNKKIAAVVLCLILLFHTLLAVGFVAYFFRPPSNSIKSIPATTISPPATIATKVEALEKNVSVNSEKSKSESLVSNTLEKTSADEKQPKKRRVKHISHNDSNVAASSSQIVMDQNINSIKNKV